MGIERDDLSREEQRRLRRKKERAQAIAILAGAVVVIILVLAVIIGTVVRVVSIKKDRPKDKVTDQVEMTADASDAESEAGGAKAEDAAADAEQKPDVSADTDETVIPEDTQEAASEEDMPTEEDTQVVSQDTNEEIEQLVENQLAAMSLEQKVSQLFFVTPEQLMGRESPLDSIGSDFNEKLNEYQVGGIILKEGNMTGAEGLMSVTSNIPIMAQSYMFVGVEEEGGTNSPFVRAEVTENVLSSQKEIGEGQGEAGAYSLGISIGSELKQYGFNVAFAPLADVETTGASLVASRTFGTDEDTTAKLAKSVVQGLSDQGIVSCVKYFPSYGDVAQSRGAGQLISQKSKEDLENDAQIYKTALSGGADFLMISHVSLPKIRGDKRPASLSKEIITDIVRDEWGYDGIVITDYMDQPCIYQKYTYAEAAAGAIEAGADMLLSTKNFLKSYNGILDAVKGGTLTEERIDESVRRILRVKYRQKIA